jgi:ubiquinone/menaquinone biosynthesis C-methylase UbiE
VAHWRELFGTHAAEFDRFAHVEDHARRLPPVLDQIHSFDGRDVVEVGAGTGRLTRAFAPRVRHIWAFDIEPPMLTVAAMKLRERGHRNWSLGLADNRALPLRDDIADIALAGWTFAVFIVWEPPTWRRSVQRAVSELRRVLRPGGTAMIVETLGTGRETPCRPERLAPYYAWLEEDQGFAFTWVRTDLRAASQADVDAARLYLGDDVADSLHNDLTVPQCTGIWWQQV